MIITRVPFTPPIPDDNNPSKSSGALRGYVESEKLVQLAFVPLGTVAVGYGIGWWADNHWHQHWIAIAGIAFGSVSGVFYVIKTAVTAEFKSRKEEPIQNGNEDGTPDDRP
ncbi:MAG: AtpZ/AtpI family protein [Terracidiphilus sp.]